MSAGFYTVSPSTYTPSQTTGCKMYFTADVGVTQSSNSVSQWNDQSGNNNHAYSTSPYNPTYNSTGPCISNGILNTTTGFSSTSMSFFMVIVPQSVKQIGIDGYALYLNNYDLQVYLDYNTMTLRIQIPNNTPVILYTMTTDTMYLVFVNLSFSSLKPVLMVRINGTTIYNQTLSLNSISPYNATQVCIGGIYGDVDSEFLGSIYALVVYNTILAESDYQKIEGYLAWKWFGNATVLPNTHSYKNISPIYNTTQIYYPLFQQLVTTGPAATGFISSGADLSTLLQVYDGVSTKISTTKFITGTGGQYDISNIFLKYVSSITNPVTNTLSASSLGAYGIIPWYTSWGITSTNPFTSSNYWIYNSSNSAAWADGLQWSFQQSYVLATATKATIYFLVDNNLNALYVNNINVIVPSSTYNNNNSAVTVALYPGTNLIDFYCKNLHTPGASPNPSGIIYLVKNTTTNTLLFQSDGTTKFRHIFLPSDIGGLVNFFSADIGVISSNNLVSVWNDQTAYGYNATQSTQGLRPLLSSTGLNSLPCVLFDGSTSGMMLTCTSTNAYSTSSICLVMYAHQKTTNDNNILSTDGAWATNSGRVFLTQNTLTPSIKFYDSTASTFSTLTDGVPCIFIFTTSIVSNTATINLYVNGNNVQTATETVTGSTLNYNQVDIGGWSNGQTGTFYGGISSLLIYNTVLSTPNRQLIEGYLAWKWFCKGGVANPLPSSHPYYTTFLVTDIPGLCNFFSADYGVRSSNGLVSEWVDQSGYDWNATQATSGKQPTLSYTGLNMGPCIVFDGTTEGMMLSFKAGTDTITSFTLCMVLYIIRPTSLYNGSIFTTTTSVSDGGVNFYMDSSAMFTLVLKIYVDTVFITSL